MKSVVLHNMLGAVARQNRDILFALAGMESKLLSTKLSAVAGDRPIFVTGLARSGTSVLLDLISRHQSVASFRYMDYPFVMVPYFWSKFLRLNERKEYVEQERSHADRLKVTPQSPEAMEEIVWQHFFENVHDPSVCNALDGSVRHREFDVFYVDMIKKMLLARDRPRYLAKNNYAISRLGYIHRLFPKSRVILMFRDPVWHIASLMKQHSLLSEEETRDKHILAYMQDTGHYEFGLDLRPLNLSDSSRTSEISALWSAGENVLAWAKYWTDVYTYIANTLESTPELRAVVKVVNYEMLCESSVTTLASIYDHLELDVLPQCLEESSEKLSVPAYYTLPFSDDSVEMIKAETGNAFRRMEALAAGD